MKHAVAIHLALRPYSYSFLVCWTETSTKLQHNSKKISDETYF